MKNVLEALSLLMLVGSTAHADYQCPGDLIPIFQDFVNESGIGAANAKATAYLIAKNEAESNVNSTVSELNSSCSELEGTTSFYASATYFFEGMNDPGTCQMNDAGGWICMVTATKDEVVCCGEFIMP